jgi:ribosomal protein L7/L12
MYDNVNINAIQVTALAEYIVKSVSDQRIEAIKLLRGFTGLGLKESKDIIEAVSPRNHVEAVERILKSRY